MSREQIDPVGITDPTLQWVNQAEALLQAPGIDPVQTLMAGRDGTFEDGGYLIAANVHLGDGVSSTELYSLRGGKLTVSDLKRPEEMYGTGYATATFGGNVSRAKIISGNLANTFSEYDSPGYADFTNGQAAVVSVGETGNFIAVTEPTTGLHHSGMHIKSFNPLTDSDYDRSARPVQLARVVRNREDALAVCAAICQGAGLDAVGQGLYAAKVNEQLHAMAVLEGRRWAAERKALDRGPVVGALVRFAEHRLGISLGDDRV